MENSAQVTLLLVAPLITLVFGLVFAAAWWFEKKRHYLLFLAAGCALFMLGSAAQILWIPPYRGPNAMVSGLFYTSAVILITEGILLRSGRNVGWKICLGTLAVVMVALGYFFYIHESLLVRIYVQNFSYGLIMLAGALRLIPSRSAKPIDKFLFWFLLVFAIQFFPRTLLTVGFQVPNEIKAFAYSAFWQFAHLFVGVLGTGLAFTTLAAAVSDVLDDLRQARDTDGLTGLLNRRGFENVMAEMLKRAVTPGVLILCDIDHFKRINDTYGHDTGDAALKMFADILAGNVRENDVVGRLGGEEFAIFLPEAALAEGTGYAERIRAAVSSTLLHVPGKERRLTASFGVTEVCKDDTWQAIYKHADMQLYDAKARGRNTVVA